MYECPCIIYEIAEGYTLDATIYLLIQITLHVSGIYMPIFKNVFLPSKYYASMQSVSIKCMGRNGV